MMKPIGCIHVANLAAKNGLCGSKSNSQCIQATHNTPLLIVSNPPNCPSERLEPCIGAPLAPASSKLQSKTVGATWSTWGKSRLSPQKILDHLDAKKKKRFEPSLSLNQLVVALQTCQNTLKMGIWDKKRFKNRSNTTFSENDPVVLGTHLELGRGVQIWRYTSF